MMGPLTTAPQLLFIPTLGPLEVIVLLVIVLILFGPGKIPEVFGALGDGLKQFKKASSSVSDEINQQLDDLKTETKTEASTESKTGSTTTTES